MGKQKTLTECKDRCIHLLEERKYEMALMCANDMLDIYERNNETHLIENIFVGYERFYLNVSKSILYITYLHRLMDIYIVQERQLERIDIGYYIADLYLKVKEYDKAEMMFSSLLKMAKELAYYKGYANMLNGLGNVQTRRNNFDKALDFYMSAYKLSKAHGYKRGTRIAHNIGYIFKETEQYEKAISYFSIALETMMSLGEYDFCANTHNEMGETYIRDGKFELAKLHLEKGLNLGIRANSMHFIQENYLFQSKLYEKLNEFQKSLEYFKKFHDIESTISKAHHKLEVNQFQYEMKLKNKAEENEAMRLKNLELDGISRELKRTNIALEDALKETKLMHEKAFRSEKHAAYNRMIIGISHMINTFIGNVMIAATHVDEKVNDIEVEFEDGLLTKNGMTMFLGICHQDMSIINNSLERIVRFVDKLKNVPLSADEIGLSRRVDDLIEECKYEMQNKYPEIDCVCNVRLDDDIPVLEGAEIFRKVFIHLFDNAFKYAFSDVNDCQIDIVITLNDSNDLVITFSDNGAGIDEDNLKRIFDPFYTTNMGTIGGSGLGLYFTYKMISEVLEGSIKCESKEGSGTSFIITVPNKGVIDLGIMI